MRLHKQVDQKILDGHRIVTDLAVARRMARANVSPVKLGFVEVRASCVTLNHAVRKRRLVAIHSELSHLDTTTCSRG
jgi:hypothetical protein